MVCLRGSKILTAAFGQPAFGIAKRHNKHRIAGRPKEDLRAQMNSNDFQTEVRSHIDRPRLAAAPASLAASVRRFDTPLTLPTISLLIAFSANPALRAVNIPLMLWNAYPIALRAWSVWRREGRLNVDFLDTLAVVVSLAQGDPMAGAVVTWLIKLGDWMRDLTAAGSRRAITDLMGFQAKQAWLSRNGEIVAIPACELQVGDEVVAHPGELIPVDGVIIDGCATVDQRTITGESLPVARIKGQSVFAATAVREGQLTIRATQVGAGTNVAQIANLVDSAPAGDTRMQNHAEKFADRLVIPTLGLAICAALYSGNMTFVLSLLIIDFGTGIRVAAPIAVLASMIRAARAGIIFRCGAHMERLAEVDTVIFDKTGTLTLGSPEVVDIISYAEHIPVRHVVGLAAAVQARLQHPLAAALLAKAEELGADIPLCVDRKYEIGLGVEGRADGHHILVGSDRFMRLRGIDIGEAANDRPALDDQGYSCLYIAVDGKFAGLAPYSDKIRAESREIIQRLHAIGIRNTVLLTGDNGALARAVGARLGLSRVFAEMLPADKAEVIQSFQRTGHVVAMVGDGINDSPALSYADVGVAVKHGSEIARESADVILMEDSLWKLVKAIEIARRSVKLIKENCAIVAGMNSQAMALLLTGVLVNPVIIALISNGSGIIASLSGISPILRRRRD
jgi:heavy metal translocating P-type ATPase